MQDSKNNTNEEMEIIVDDMSDVHLNDATIRSVAGLIGLFAVPFIPIFFREHKPVGAGKGQVARVSWDKPVEGHRPSGSNYVAYRASVSNAGATLTITHNDGSTQKWKLSPNPKPDATDPRETKRITISYDSKGTITSVTIL